ncbi:MAG: phospholipase D family protein [Opitutaceae bacterium]|nr:phospholipase D family protein [Opitutaceae bacterium]
MTDGCSTTLTGSTPASAVEIFALMMCRAKAVTVPWFLVIALTCASTSASTGASVDRPAGDPAGPNRVAIVSGGYDALLLRVHLIRQAKASIAIQTFIWTNDECGRLMICELIEAARRGVKVRIIADHMFSDQDPDTVAFLATVHPNFEVKHYRPSTERMKPSLFRRVLAGLRSFHELNQRMHNKVMIVDEGILLTGGRNIENTYFDHSTGLNFRDRDVLAVGPVARAAAESFEEYWRYRHSVSSRALADVDAAIRKGTFRRYPTRADYDFGPYFKTLDEDVNAIDGAAARFMARLRPARRVEFIADKPGKSDRSTATTARLTGELAGMLQRATTSVVIQTPYLVLSPPARKLFRDIQDRHPGLRIRISTNSFASTDNIFAYSANYRLRNEYVQHLGLLVHEFKPHPASMPALFPRFALMNERSQATTQAGPRTRPPFLCVHAKSLVIDDQIAFIGSYNLDPRSENLNTEVGLLIDDPALAQELRTEIERDLLPENSWVIARRALPVGVETVNGWIDGILSLSPVDIWPIQNTSSFELRRGATPVPPEHPSFHQHYLEVGSFPGTDGLLSTKEILTRLYKAVGAPLTPIL